MVNFKNIDFFRPEIKENLLLFLKGFFGIHGEHIQHVTIYGSAVTEDYISGLSDVNSLIVMDQLDVSVLKKSLKLVAEGLTLKMAAPLLLTPDFMKSSMDVFALEFANIKEQHITVYGDDFWGELPIPERYTRLFCEQHLKSTWIRVRQVYLEAGLRPQGIENILRHSLLSLLPIFRHVLKLKGQIPGLTKDSILLQITHLLGDEAGVFLKIYQSRTDHQALAGNEQEMILQKYLLDLERLAALVSNP